jgi:hypothetical protein
MTNPAFFLKMGFIALAVVAQGMIDRRLFRGPAPAGEPLPPRLRMLAVASLTCWLGAITAGRLLAYVGEVSGLK